MSEKKIGTSRVRLLSWICSQSWKNQSQKSVGLGSTHMTHWSYQKWGRITQDKSWCSACVVCCGQPPASNCAVRGLCNRTMQDWGWFPWLCMSGVFLIGWCSCWLLKIVASILSKAKTLLLIEAPLLRSFFAHFPPISGAFLKGLHYQFGVGNTDKCSVCT